MYSKEHLGSLLVKAGVITPADLASALNQAEEQGRRLGEVLIERGLTSEEQIQHFIGIQLGYPTVKLAGSYIDNDVAKLIPEKFARRFGVLPLYRSDSSAGRVVVVAMSDPTNIMVLDEVRRALNEEVFVALASQSELDRFIDRLWVEKAEESPVRAEEVHVLPGGDEETKPSVARILETMFNQALEMRAGAIHLEPKQKFASVRYRVDGQYVTMTSLPRETYQAVLTRIKILAKIVIAESVVDVEEGRFHVRLDASQPFIDVRVTIVPEVFGEKAILKITRRSDIVRPFGDLGLFPDQSAVLEKVLERTAGLILVSGRNDSGKTTMAYSMLSHVGSSSTMVVTLEDPPAYPISSLNQVKRLKATGGKPVSWEQMLKAVERQEPNVVYVSNVDTPEDVRILLRLAATGRMVIATLSADDATSSHWVPFQLGADSFAVGSALRAAVACRLIRILCPSCRKAVTYSAEELLRQGWNEPELRGARLFTPVGCDACGGTGYRGRLGVYEIMPVMPHIKDLIDSRSGSDQVRQAAIDAGMVTLRGAAIRRALEGATSLEELSRLGI